MACWPNQVVATAGTDLSMALVVAAWFALNISIGCLTKWLFLYGEICVEGRGCRRFNFPLTMTVVHLLLSQAVCYLYVFHVRRSLRGSQLDGMQRLRKVLPLAACFAASVGLGNLSLNYIYPSFKQMVGAGSPVVTVAMSVAVTGTRYNWWTWASMPLICGGLWVCAQDEVHFSFFGAVFAVGAMVLRSAKSIVQARLLSKEERIDPVTLLYYMSPYAACLVLAMALATEGVEPFTWLASGAAELIAGSGAGGTGLLRLLLLLLLSGLNACFLNITGFLVTRCTSAVTLQVLGSVKSCLGIAISVAVLRNPLQLSQAAGVLVCLLGVWVYERRGGSIKVPTRAKEG